ncbi:lysylphosphatidylglycerol synthase transmembrane domain-containing protein [Actinoalloteichus spitiensis]|uniref:lysylphosphatidylglycerol synthase transmembrane domain-containing protein n=1 Tax=Actinoalloteichus spitiensis TaxID=252394 RepID=UPI000381ABF1|nr:YbhN family protein [Actinoalloteichus spitiensis]
MTEKIQDPVSPDRERAAGPAVRAASVGGPAQDHQDEARPDAEGTGLYGADAPAGMARRTARTLRRLAALRGVRTTVTLAILVIAAVIVTRGLWDQRGEIGDAARDLSPLVVLLSFLPALLGVALMALAWREPLQALSTTLGARDTVRLYAVGVLGKYVPGLVWSVVLQASLAARHRVTATHLTAAFGAFLMVSLTAGIVVALPVSALMFDGGVLLLLGGLAGAAASLVLIPWSLALCLRWAARLRPLRSRLVPVAIAPLRRGVWICSLFWLVTGAHLWVLAVGLGADPVEAVLPAVGGFALATVAGNIAFIVPDGLGIREGVLVALLTTCLPLGAAVVAATASRVLLVLADVVFFLWGTWSVRRDARRGVLPSRPATLGTSS